MDSLEIAEIIGEITYKKGWFIRFRAPTNDRPYVQVEVSTDSEAAISSITGKVEPWRGGKHYLSTHMCRQEIVGTVFGAIKAAEEHEMREWFRYRGASIYNPHLDPDKLADLASKKGSFCVRANAMLLE